MKLKNATETNLIISDIQDGEPELTVDGIEVAQFIHLLLRNDKIRGVIDTITAKVILILGRFDPSRKSVLDAMRRELRSRDYLPIIFDFEKPTSRDTVETISTLAHMSRFVIADLTEAKSVLQELQRVVPSLPSVPVQPLLLDSDYEPGMLDHFKNFHSFLQIYRYRDLDELVRGLSQYVIEPAEMRVKKVKAIVAE